MRLRIIASDVLFAISGLTAIAGIHKYVFGNFPKLWIVRDLPWDSVNPWVACGSALFLAFVAARVARSPVRQQVLDTPTTPAEAGMLPNAANPIATRHDGQREPSSARHWWRSRSSD